MKNLGEIGEITLDIVKELAADEGENSVSIYIPCFVKGDETLQNPIRFRKMAREAKEQLVESGMAESKAEKYLETLFNMEKDEKFWQKQSLGLALFFRDGNINYFRLPVEFEEFAKAGASYYIAPLLELFNSEGKFYILSLNLEDVKMYKCTKNTVSERSVKDMPTSLKQAMWADDPEKSIQHHSMSGSRPGGPNQQTVYHGHGVTDEDKVKILRFFQMVDDAIERSFASISAPMVLAGQSHITSIYRDANSYRHIEDETIDKSASNLRKEELLELGWEVVKNKFESEEKEAVGKYNDLSNSDKASNDMKGIAAAAFNQRISTLFIAKNKHQAGRYDTSRKETIFEEELKYGNEDIYDFAARHTLRNGGRVFVCDESETPGNKGIAAIYRY